MVFLIWTMRSTWFGLEHVWFGREHPAFLWPPPHALVDRWPPLWVPHSVRLSNARGGARILSFPPHAGRGDVHDPDEPPYRLITVGVDEVTNLVLIWSDGSRALRRACRARAARARVGIARPTHQVYANRRVRPREEHERLRAHVIVNVV